MTGEATHEAARDGVFRAKALLERLVRADLPFNAYDHQEKMTFNGRDVGLSQFSFDLKGTLRGRSIKGRENVVEVFVEVKAYAKSHNLVQLHEDFLRRAAFVSQLGEHRSTWFAFVSSSPFGSTIGEDLCNGKTLSSAVEK